MLRPFTAVIDQICLIIGPEFAHQAGIEKGLVWRRIPWRISPAVPRPDLDESGFQAGVARQPGQASRPEQGFARWFKRYASHGAELTRLEAEARAARRGPWGQPNPVPPWDWRRGDGVPQTAIVIGNRRSRVYHRPTCPGAADMSAKDRVGLETTAQAEAVGYRRAGDCR